MELTIEKMIYGGDGLARLPANQDGRGKAVFVPFTLPGEKLEVSLTEEKPGFARAQIDRVLEPSQERIPAPCPYFQRCGGCHYQHAGYEHQLQLKVAILEETLRRQAKLELDSAVVVHASPPWNYRNRSRFQVRAGSHFAAGYFQLASHVLLPVEECPISSPLINRALGVLWELGRSGKVAHSVREVELFSNDEGKLLAQVYLEVAEDQSEDVRAGADLVELLRAAIPELVSGYVFAQKNSSARGARGHLTEAIGWSVGDGDFRYRAADVALRVSGGSFFQVNRFLVDELVNIVTASRAGDLALDLYAGVGLFTGALASSFRHVVAVESSQSSVSDLKYNCPANGKAVRATVEDYLGRKAKKIKPELVVVDPPRAGLGQRVTGQLVALAAPRLTYVSCDPATMARDLVDLRAAGYRIEKLHLMDLFPQTYHIESVVQLVR